MAKNTPRPVLSVGMIVKNEERNLEKCLTALQPLLRAVPSELIIADTGSTDATREIAARYTDMVFDVPWNNDFAAARNATLDRAQGEWYLYVDADEVFVNADDLIAFLQDGAERKRYCTADYTLRNFWYYGSDRYTDLRVSRLYKTGPGVRFQSKIHEYIPVKSPRKNLGALAHHFGYMTQPGELSEKAKRNIPLLLELHDAGSEDPARLCYLLQREYASLRDYVTAERYIREGIGFLPSGDSELRRGLWHDLADAAFQQGQWEKALEAVDGYLSGKSSPFVTDLDIRYIAANAYISMGVPVRALDEAREYLRVAESFANGQIDDGDRSIVQILHARPQDVITMRLCEADSLLLLGRPAEAFPLLETTISQSGFTPSLHVYEMERACVAALKLWDRYPGRYLSLRGDETALGRIRAQITELMESDPEARQGIGEAFVRARAPLDDWFAALCRLRARKEVPDEALAPLLSGMPPEPECAEMLYYAMERKLDIAPFVNRVDSDDLYIFINTMEHKTAFGETAGDYYAAMPEPTDLRGLRWKFVLLERILLNGNPDSPAYRRDFAAYCKSLERYTAEVYGEITERVLSVIPRGHRFGIYMARAGKARDAGKGAEYVRFLRLAGEAYPCFLPLIKTMVAQIQETLNNQVEIDAEAALLARQVKQKIREFILAGDMENGARALEAYAKVRPEDPDLEALRLQLCPAPAGLS